MLVTLNKTCFCCIGLGTGAIIVGIVGLIGNVVNIILNIFALVFIVTNQIPSDSLTLGNILVSIVSSLVMTALSVIMLIGTLKKRPELLVHWIVWTPVFVLLNSAVACVHVYFQVDLESYYAEKESSRYFQAYLTHYFAVWAPFLIVVFYFWFVVFSYRVELLPIAGKTGTSNKPRPPPDGNHELQPLRTFSVA